MKRNLQIDLCGKYDFDCKIKLNKSVLEVTKL